MTPSPGSRLIAVIALIMPWPERAEWVEEWRAELAHGYERMLVNGTPAWLAALSLRLRCLGAVRDAWWLRRGHGGGWMLHSDVRMALRGMRRRPAFAATIVLTVALGIGGTTAIFSVIDPLLLRPLPYPEVDRLAEVHRVWPNGNVYPSIDKQVWKTLRETMVPDVFERIEAGYPHHVVVTGTREPEELRVQAFTPGALSLLGARAVLGRLFTDDDAAAGAPEVVVLGESVWRRAFGADRGVLGRTIALNGKPFTVIGVVQQSFKYPLGTVSMWLPLRIEDPIWPVRGYEALVRLRAGVSREAAQARIDALGNSLADEHPRPETGRLLSVEPLDSRPVEGVQRALRLLGGAVACVLLIACVNAANLLLVRSAGRQTELAVRRSLGATGSRLFRQLVTESLVLSLAGGALGVLLAYGGVRLIVGLVPDLLVRYTQATVEVDGRVLAFSLVLSLLTGIVFGAGPAIRGARQARLAGASERSVTSSAAVRRVGGSLVVVELALSMMLLVVAALLTRSFVGLVTLNPGFHPDGLVMVYMRPAPNRYPDDHARELFYGSLRERLQRLPGVQGVTIADGVPPNPSGFRSALAIETDGGETRAIGDLRLPYVVAESEYFDVLGIPILAGRTFGPEDTPRSPASVLIDPDLATLLWPDASPIGRRFRIDPEEPWLTVVGVAGDVKLMGPDDRRSPYELYYAASQQPLWRNRTVAVRASGDPARLMVDIRNTVYELDPEQPIPEITRAQALFGQSLQRQRFVLTVMGVFALIAVALAAVGVYGVLSYLVAQRTREIGVRIALGATPRSVIGTVLGRGLALAALGGAVGAGAAFALSRFLVSMLYDVDPTDAWTLAVVGGVLMTVAVAAALVPALRAGRVSPLQALRAE